MSKHKDQHIIPQVYLKLFGFKKAFKTEIWFVSVRDLEKGIWQDRMIEAFLTESYAYNLDSSREVSRLIIEKKLNWGIENRIHQILSQLEEDKINPNIQMAIAETTANFLCRSNNVRNWIQDCFAKLNFRDFFNMITVGAFNSSDKADFIFKEYLALPEKDRVNTIMVHYMHYVSVVLQKASIEIIKGSDKFLFFTSDNPVSLMNEIGFGEIERGEMEIYFPLSSKFLIRFYWNNDSKEIKRTITNVTEELYSFYHKEVVPNSALNYIISPIDKSLVGK